MQCGLLGEKLSHSYSPQIHKQLGSYSYTLFEKAPEEIADFLENGDFHGLNVTVPYKKTVIPFCHKLTPQAEKLQAINTIVRQPDGTLLGHNTDYYGFHSMATRIGMDYSDKKVLVLGSGGSSNTVCAVMKSLNANVIVISRSGENNYNNLHLHKDCAVIVNTTPVGMYPNTQVSPVDLSAFPNLEAVLDIIYNPARTKLLLDAQKRNLKTENGLWMLVAQAKESAQWFLGKEIEDECIVKIHNSLRMNMENIVLIGMPGCGKSTNGKLLAKMTGREFVDTDEKIEQLAGCSIPEIFKLQGEAGFRTLETKVLAEVCKCSGLVIATGGGCVTRPENFPLLRQNSTVIWLKRPVDQLPTNGRPLSQAGSLQAMYEIREPLYDTFCHYCVDCSATAEETSSHLLSFLGKEDSK